MTKANEKKDASLKVLCHQLLKSKCYIVNVERIYTYLPSKIETPFLKYLLFKYLISVVLKMEFLEFRRVQIVEICETSHLQVFFNFTQSKCDIFSLTVYNEKIFVI